MKIKREVLKSVFLSLCIHTYTHERQARTYTLIHIHTNSHIHQAVYVEFSIVLSYYYYYYCCCYCYIFVCFFLPFRCCCCCWFRLKPNSVCAVVPLFRFFFASHTLHTWNLFTKWLWVFSLGHLVVHWFYTHYHQQIITNSSKLHIQHTIFEQFNQCEPFFGLFSCYFIYNG